MAAGFPIHTVLAVYMGNFTVALLSFLTLMQGVDALPNLYPPMLRRIATIMAACIFGSYSIIHLLTPLGLLPGVSGIFASSLLLWVLGTLPVIIFPLFREILHETPQTWLMGLQTMRAMAYLFLTSYDSGLLPAGYAIPVGWGGVITGMSSPVAAHAFATRPQYAQQIGFFWNFACLAELLVSLMCGGTVLEKFLEQRLALGKGVRYLWYTAWLVPRFTVPLLALMHGYSLFKLFTEKEEVALIWEESDDEVHSLYDLDSVE